METGCPITLAMMWNGQSRARHRHILCKVVLECEIKKKTSYCTRLTILQFRKYSEVSGYVYVLLYSLPICFL